jgi:hypothetical protein
MPLSLATLAQVRWDASAEVGAMTRFSSGGALGAPSAALGPSAELLAHLAVLPMLRLGGYLAYDLSPVAGAVRSLGSAGLDARLSPPLLPVPWRVFASVGIGYGAADGPGPFEGPRVDAPFARGGFLELPVALALAYRLDRTWETFVEVGGKVGLWFTGSLYGEGAYLGRDSFALSLSLGVNLNQ